MIGWSGDENDLPGWWRIRASSLLSVNRWSMGKVEMYADTTRRPAVLDFPSQDDRVAFSAPQASDCMLMIVFEG